MARKVRTQGAQSLRRGMGLIRLIGRHQVEGLTIGKLVALSGLERPTVHRLVNCLAEEGFLDRHPDTRCYRLGSEMFRLGVHFFDRAPLTDDYIYATRRIALETDDTTVLGARQGDNWYCLHREDSTHPGKVLSTNVGGRHLLGITAGGLAILALLPDSEIDRLLAEYAADYKRAKLTPAQIVQGIAATRHLGYARSVNEVTPNIGSVGVAFRIDADTLASIAVGTDLSRLKPPRCEKIGALIHRELRAVLSRSKNGGRVRP